MCACACVSHIHMYKLIIFYLHLNRPYNFYIVYIKCIYRLKLLRIYRENIHKIFRQHLFSLNFHRLTNSRITTVNNKLELEEKYLLETVKEISRRENTTQLLLGTLFTRGAFMNDLILQTGFGQT